MSVEITSAAILTQVRFLSGGRLLASFFSVLMAALSVFTISPATAAEKCLAQFPDSAWAKGQPAEVSNFLNRDLVRTKMRVIRISDQTELATTDSTLGLDHFTLIPEYLNNSRTKYVSKYDYQEKTYPVEVQFEYQGLSCAIREIKVQGGSITYKPFKQYEFSDPVGVKKVLGDMSREDFIVIQQKAEVVNNFAKYLESTKVSPIKISFDKSNSEDPSSMRLGLDKLVNPSVGIRLKFVSEDGCFTNNAKYESALNSGFNSLSEVDKTFFQRFLSDSFGDLIFANGKKLCKLRVSTDLKQSYSNYLAKSDLGQLFGYVWVADSSPTTNKVKIIYCLKGSSLKKISGVNPKCPSGYKVKS